MFLTRKTNEVRTSGRSKSGISGVADKIKNRVVLFGESSMFRFKMSNPYNSAAVSEATAATDLSLFCAVSFAANAVFAAGYGEIPISANAPAHWDNA